MKFLTAWIIVQFLIRPAWCKGVSVAPSSSYSSCLSCYCDMPTESAVCIDKGRNSLPCSTVIRLTMPGTQTCFRSSKGVGLETIQPSGVLAQRSDCCASWVEIPFDSIVGEYRVYNEKEEVYQKNHTLNIWQLLQTSPLPPTYDFPGVAAAMAGNLGGVVVRVDSIGMPLKYDNTTCKHRCCVQGLVDRSKTDPLSAECIADWRRCVSVGFDGDRYPQCSETNSGTLCTIWVPCSTWFDWELEPCITVTFFMILVALVIWYRATSSGYNDGLGSFDSINLLLGYACIPMLILTLLSSCEYIHWAETTAVNPQYISYQGCVAACNSMKFPAAVVLDRFCGDSDPDVISSRQWAIWAEDFNPLYNNQSACPDHYCSQCGSKTGDLDKMLSLAQFLRVRTYISCVMVLVLTIFPVNIAWAFGCIVCLAEWITAVIFVTQTVNSDGARYQLNAYAGLGKSVWYPPLFEMLCACLGVDVALFCLLGIMAGCLQSQMKKKSGVDQTNQSVSGAGGGARSIFHVSIDPKYIRLRE